MDFCLIRMWDVGYHATIEHRDPQSNNKKIQKDGTHQSPRAHMRRGIGTPICTEREKKSER